MTLFVFLLVLVFIISIILVIIMLRKPSVRKIKSVSKTDKDHMNKIYKRSMSNMSMVIQKLVRLNFEKRKRPSLREVDMIDMFHWPEKTKPVIIASREFLVILSTLGIKNKLYIDNIIYYIEPKTNVLCMSTTIVLPFRMEKRFNITYKSIEKKTEDFERLFNIKIPKHMMVPEKLGHKSEALLIRYISAIKHDRFIEKSKDCYNHINDVLKIWDNKKMIYEMSKSEFNNCKNIAASITFNNKNLPSNEKQNMNKDKSSYSKTLQGVITEVATCRMLKTLVQTHHTYTRTAKTDTFDGTLQNGMTFDVKSVTQNPDGIIVGHNKFPNPADLYILAYARDAENDHSDHVEDFKKPIIEVIGFAKAEMFEKYGQNTPFGLKLALKYLKPLKDVI